MKIDKKTVHAKFISRPNRFQAYVNIEGEELMVHVPNTGRCKEILLPGCVVILREEDNPNRKTKYDLIAGYKGNKLINIDSQIPNKVVEEALLNKKIYELQKYDIIQREKVYGNSRFDFKLSNNNGEIFYLEVKGVTLEEDGFARFPDAPTDRGRKHVMELIEIKRAGMDAGILFLMQMDNINKFTPNEDMDKPFSEAVRLAKANDVNIFAYDCLVDEKHISLNKSIEIILWEYKLKI